MPVLVSWCYCTFKGRWNLFFSSLHHPNDLQRMAVPIMAPSVSPWHLSLHFQPSLKPNNLSLLSAQFVPQTKVTVGWSCSQCCKCFGACVVESRGSWQLGVPAALTAISKVMLAHSRSVNTYITHTHAAALSSSMLIFLWSALSFTEISTG